jgi:hypothetical protein
MRRSTTRQRRARAAAAVLVAAAAACFALGQVPSNHPLIPALAFSSADVRSLSNAAPARALPHSKTTFALGGPTTASYGRAYTLTGRTGDTMTMHAPAAIVMRGRWGRGAWRVLSKTSSDAAGRYRISIVLNRRGRLDLRLATPDGYTGAKTLTVRVTSQERSVTRETTRAVVQSLV